MIINSDEERANSLFEEGNRFFEQKEFYKAEKLYKEALELRPNSEDILYNLVLVYFEEQEYYLAYEIVKQLNDVDCKDLIIELEKKGYDFSNGLNKKSNGFKNFTYLIILLYVMVMLSEIFTTHYILSVIVRALASIGICIIWLKSLHNHKLKRLVLLVPGCILLILGSLGVGLLISDILGKQKLLDGNNSFLEIIVVYLTFGISLLSSYYLCFEKKLTSNNFLKSSV